MAHPDRWPPLPDHVLIEVLPGAQAQTEPTVAEDLHRRGLLRHHRRVAGRLGEPEV
jgi:hypothetical protein